MLPLAPLAILLAALSVDDSPAGPAAGETSAATYSNPVTEVHLADPTVVRHEGKFLLYATGHEPGLRGHRVYTSTDLVHWTAGDVAYRTDRPKVWAPDVWQDPESGRWYLYWTVDECIGVAEAESPYGPFKDVKQFVERAIDAHLFRDDDGKLYLYYVKFPGFNITVQPMKDPVTPEGEPKVILHPEAEWERVGFDVTEGPWILKHEGLYYLLYSGSPADRANYAVGYATSASPTGPFTRAEENPVIRPNFEEGVYGPGHGCVVADGAGQLWHVYHQKRTGKQEWDRFIAIDRLWFDEEGKIHSEATRGEELPAPTPLSGSEASEGESKGNSEGYKKNTAAQKSPASEGSAHE